MSRKKGSKKQTHKEDQPSKLVPEILVRAGDDSKTTNKDLLFLFIGYVPSLASLLGFDEPVILYLSMLFVWIALVYLSIYRSQLRFWRLACAFCITILQVWGIIKIQQKINAPTIAIAERHVAIVAPAVRTGVFFAISKTSPPYLIPIEALISLKITNVSPYPILLSSCSGRVRARDGWSDMKRVDLLAHRLVVAPESNLSRAVYLEHDYPSLESFAESKQIEATRTIETIAAFEYLSDPLLHPGIDFEIRIDPERGSPACLKSQERFRTEFANNNALGGLNFRLGETVDLRGMRVLR